MDIKETEHKAFLLDVLYQIRSNWNESVETISKCDICANVEEFNK